MDQLRTEIWDCLYRSGPQTVEQIAGKLGMDATAITEVIAHQWFEIQDCKVQIATGKPPTSANAVS